MKIVSLNKSNHGQKRVIAFDGEIQIGADGTADVSEKAAKHLVDNHPEWDYAGSEAVKKVESVEADSKEDAVDYKSENELLKQKIAEMEAKANESAKASDDVVDNDEGGEEGDEESEAEEDEKPKNVASVAGEDDAPKQSAEEAKAEQIKAAKEVLEGKKKGELQDMCVKQGFPKEEWENLLVADLREYILGKV